MLASGVQTLPSERLSELLTELGYDRSPHYLARGRGLESAPDFGHIYRRAVGSQCQLQGVYLLRPPQAQASSIPVVYICQADSEEHAQQIHRLVWNQGLVPFLMVVSPRTIRLYSGFRYRVRDEKGGEDTSGVNTGDDAPALGLGLLEVLRDVSSVSQQLADFYADAIDSGQLWAQRGQTLDVSGRVDWNLLDNLSRLGQNLMRDGSLTKPVAHALIGKYVYLHYLRDRQILSDRKLETWGIRKHDVFGRTATLEGLTSLTGRLESWLNGQIFPLPLLGPNAPTQAHLQRVAGAFAGDEGEQLHLAFEAYDFSYIPIETLSVIYEQFLHAEDDPAPHVTPQKDAGPEYAEDGPDSDEDESDTSQQDTRPRQKRVRAKKLGAFYTPIPLVNFVLDELDSHTPLARGIRVMDPACGSGAFLVQCYRRLIEHSFKVGKGERPQPGALRDLLTEHIFGVDLDEDACRVTEMSLLLTLLDYVDPPDLESIHFKLPTLHNANIFHGNFFDPTLNLSRDSAPLRFHRIVANPPWKNLKPGQLDPEDRLAWKWMQTHQATQPVGDNQVARAFAWKALDHLEEGGEIGIIIPAMTLFDTPSKDFRQAFFQHVKVRAIANFSNLTEVLFAGRSRVPAAVFVYSPREEAFSADERIPVFSPLVANQELTRPSSPGKRMESWSLALNASEVRDVSLTSVQSGSGLPWKLATWGSFLDQRLLERTARRFPSIDALEESKVLLLSEGPQLRTAHNPDMLAGVEAVPELIGQNRLDMGALKKLRNLFTFPGEAIVPIALGQHYVRVRGGTERPLSICRPPHVIVSAARTFAIFSDDFLVVPARQIGIVSPGKDRSFLKALSLYLSSDFVFYHQFLMSAEFGVKRDRATLDALRLLPLPVATLSAEVLREWAGLQERLAEASRQDFIRSKRVSQVPLFPKGLEENELPTESVTASLVEELNDRVYTSLGMSTRDRCLVRDLMHVKLSLNDGKVGPPAVRPPNTPELHAYAQMLRGELDAFVSSSTSKRHHVLILPSDGFGTVEIRFEEQGDQPKQPSLITQESKSWTELQNMSRTLGRDQSQWLIFNRNLRVYRGTTTYLFKPLQRFQWTESQARLDAADIIAETLSGAGGEA